MSFSCLGFWFGLFIFGDLSIFVCLLVISYSLLMNLIIMFSHSFSQTEILLFQFFKCKFSKHFTLLL